jgi:hypothetical protein
MSEKLKAVWQRPGHKERIVESAKSRWQRPGFREHMSKAVKVAWQIPEKRKRLMTPKSPEAIARIVAGLRTPEYRAKRSLLSSGPRNHFYGKPGTNRGKFGKDHPNFGRHPSPETRQKLSACKIGEKNHFFGKKHKPETKLKNSLAHRGEKSWCWRGGTSFIPYPQEFSRLLKNMIRERDDFKCRICGKMQGARKHHVHHINSKVADNRPENLLTVCVPCHANLTFHCR